MSPRAIFVAASLALAALTAFAACSRDDVGPDPARAGRPAPTSCRQDRPGSPMVLVPKPGGAFCIDKREATRGDYAAFLVAAGESAKEAKPPYVVPDICRDDWTYRPFQKQKPPPTPGQPPLVGCYDNQLPKEPIHPELAVNCVDWCDAHAFCAWSGKRLCTSIAGEASIDSAAEAGEWNLACSNGGKTVYPYGDSLEPGRCVDADSAKFPEGLSSAEPGTKAGCTGLEGPYSEIQDMSGGVEEWTGVCVKPAAGEPGGPGCTSNGGAWGHGAQVPFGVRPLDCWYAPPLALKSSASMGTGIRCCADD